MTAQLPSFYKSFNQDLSWLNTNTLHIVRHGSRAYGTNTKQSDEDFKGICVPTKPYYLGFNKHFEQAELHDPDAVIYEIKKFFNLAAASNPNIIEVLFVDDADVIYTTDLGQKIISIRDKFLSKRICFSFSGYAISQLKKLKLHRRWLLNPVVIKPTREEYGLPEHTLIPKDQLMAAEAEVQKDIDRMNFSFMEELAEPTRIAISNSMAEMLAELKITSEQQWLSSARKVGLNDNFIELMQKEREYKGKLREFQQYQNWKETRNKARFELEEKYGYDSKFAYHLVRLLRMCREIMTTGKVIVRRPDFQELLAIRNGAWTYDQLIEFAEKEDKEMQALYKTSKVLPKTPDFDLLDSVCIEIIESILAASQ